MKINKDIRKSINKFRALRTTHDKYIDSLRREMAKYGAVVDRFTIYDNKLWYLVVYKKETKELLTIIKAGFLNNEIYGTFETTMYVGRK